MNHYFGEKFNSSEEWNSALSKMGKLDCEKLWIYRHFERQCTHICIIKCDRAEIDRLRVIMLMRPDYDEGSK